MGPAAGSATIHACVVPAGVAVVAPDFVGAGLAASAIVAAAIGRSASAIANARRAPAKVFPTRVKRAFIAIRMEIPPQPKCRPGILGRRVCASAIFLTDGAILMWALSLAHYILARAWNQAARATGVAMRVVKGPAESAPTHC